jgi:hypothetical protein
MVTTDAIGRAYTFSREECITILSALGGTVDDGEPFDQLVKRINWRLDPSSRNGLKNLRTFRRVTKFEDARRMTHRGHVVDQRGNFAAK